MELVELTGEARLSVLRDERECHQLPAYTIIASRRDEATIDAQIVMHCIHEEQLVTHLV